MYWVNGQPASTTSLQDRSFQYGDGCFTTMLTKQGEVQWWDKHMERMQSCLDLLYISHPDWQLVKTWVNKAVDSQSQLSGIKLHISRGEGGRGYSPNGVAKPMVTISQFAYPSHYLDWQRDGIALGVCQQRLGLSPLLAGHKHNNRIEQVLLKREVELSGYLDSVVLDINGHVAETTIANLFWLKDDILFTPLLDKCGVAGVARRLVIEQAISWGIEVVVSDFPLEHIANADEVFITNSLLQLVPITKINNWAFSIGEYSRRFQESLTS